MKKFSWTEVYASQGPPTVASKIASIVPTVSIDTRDISLSVHGTDSHTDCRETTTSLSAQTTILSPPLLPLSKTPRLALKNVQQILQHAECFAAQDPFLGPSGPSGPSGPAQYVLPKIDLVPVQLPQPDIATTRHHSPLIVPQSTRFQAVAPTGAMHVKPMIADIPIAQKYFPPAPIIQHLPQPQLQQNPPLPASSTVSQIEPQAGPKAVSPDGQKTVTSQSVPQPQPLAKPYSTEARFVNGEIDYLIGSIYATLSTAKNGWTNVAYFHNKCAAINGIESCTPDVLENRYKRLWRDLRNDTTGPIVRQSDAIVDIDHRRSAESAAQSSVEKAMDATVVTPHSDSQKPEVVEELQASPLKKRARMSEAIRMDSSSSTDALCYPHEFHINEALAIIYCARCGVMHNVPRK